MIYHDSFKASKTHELKRLHGKCRLELLDNGKVIKSIEHDNTVTPWVSNAINKGNFFDTIPNNKEFPLTNWFSGVMLLSKQGDATQSMIPTDARVIACANNVSGSDSTDLRRGNYNQDSSSVLLDDDGRVNGYKFVWYWSDTRGNCIADEYIKAVCLTRPTLAVGRYEDSMPPDGALNELLATLTVGETLASCQIIDYENECAYAVSFANSKFVVRKYQLDTKQFHICGVFNSSNVFDVTRMIAERDDLTPSPALSSIDSRWCSLSFLNGVIHVVTWTNGTTNLVDYAIDVTDADSDNWTITGTSHTYSLDTNVTIMENEPHNYQPIGKDFVLHTGSYIYLLGTDNKIYKCSTSSDADVTDYACPTDFNKPDMFSATRSGCWIKYANGDVQKFTVTGENGSTTPRSMLYHNSEYKACLTNFPTDMSLVGVNETGYGTMLLTDRANGQNRIHVYAPYGYIATVWNDTDGGGSADQWQKTAGLTMRVIYEITEEEPTP